MTDKVATISTIRCIVAFLVPSVLLTLSISGSSLGFGVRPKPFVQSFQKVDTHPSRAVRDLRSHPLAYIGFCWEDFRNAGTLSSGPNTYILIRLPRVRPQPRCCLAIVRTLGASSHGEFLQSPTALGRLRLLQLSTGILSQN